MRIRNDYIAVEYKKENKWFIAHPDNIEKVKAGDFPECLGDIIKVNVKQSYY